MSNVVVLVCCEECQSRLEDCECEPGFPWGVVDSDSIYGDAAQQTVAPDRTTSCIECESWHNKGVVCQRCFH